MFARAAVVGVGVEVDLAPVRIGHVAVGEARIATPMRQLIGLPPQKTMALGTAQHCEACSHGAPTPVGTHGMLVVVVVAVVEVVEAPAAQPHKHWPLKVSR